MCICFFLFSWPFVALRTSNVIYLKCVKLFPNFRHSLTKWTSLVAFSVKLTSPNRLPFAIGTRIIIYTFRQSLSIRKNVFSKCLKGRLAHKSHILAIWRVCRRQEVECSVSARCLNVDKPRRAANSRLIRLRLRADGLDVRRPRNTRRPAQLSVPRVFFFPSVPPTYQPLSLFLP